MNVNEILEQIQDFDLNSVLSELGKSSHVLTQAEIIVLAAAAVVGILIGMFGLRIVRFWAGLLGFLAGLAGGTYAASLAGLDPVYAWIPGLVLGIVLAVLGAKLYRFGVFMTSWIAVSAVCQYAVRPSDWIWTAACAAAGLVFALFAIKFVKAITILATAVFGAAISGTALYYLLPLKWEWFHILLCTALGILGALVQILFVSGRRKRQNLEKAAEIRKTHSTENEVEKARALVDVLEKEEESEEPEFLDEDLFLDDEDDEESEFAGEEEFEDEGALYEEEPDGSEYFEEYEESEEYEYPDDEGESDEYEYFDEDEESGEYEYSEEGGEPEEYEYFDDEEYSEEDDYLDDEDEPDDEADDIEYLDDDDLDETDYLDDLDDIEYLDDEFDEKNRTAVMSPFYDTPDLI